MDISPEVDTGSGKIDFKLSTGFDSRVLVEIKLSTNPNIVSGYETQLEVYKTAQQTMRAFYLVIDVGTRRANYKRLLEVSNKASEQGDPLSELTFVDGTIKVSASKR